MRFQLKAIFLACSIAFTGTSQVQAAEPQQIKSVVNDANRVTLFGNTPPQASRANDRGIVSDQMEIKHIWLYLRRPVAQRQAIDRLRHDLHDRTSATFHHWLSPTEFRERFHPATRDVKKIESWLSSHGFTINHNLPGDIVIDFAGTAGEVRQAFHTEIHKLNVKGKTYVSNMSDPQIPAALVPAIAGIVSLNSFHAEPEYTYGTDDCEPLNGTGDPNSKCYQVVPADLATIYNFNPVYSDGITGSGETIVVLEASDIYSTDDWSNFRSKFGLSGYSATLTTVHPGGDAEGCDDPGVNDSYATEVAIDTEWASAAAPSAHIEIDSCATTYTNEPAADVVIVALHNRVNGSPLPLPGVISISYGLCEQELGVTSVAEMDDNYQQADSEGISVYVAAGDHGGAGCDNFAQTGEPYSVSGLAVNGLASSPNVVAVGGTDFSDTNSGTNSTYWNSTNSATFGSAKSYVPETTWNNSCANVLLANWYDPSAGPVAFCNSLTLTSPFITVTGGGGGPSSCAVLVPPNNDTCVGWTKPSWQSDLGAYGNPSDGVRDVPDVSLFASGGVEGGGVWGHSYVVCFSAITACTGSPKNWPKGGGTSFTAPIFAGIQALINQNEGENQGLTAATLYSLAETEYSNATLLSDCNSSRGNSVSASCVFYDVTQVSAAGDSTTDVPCGDTTSDVATDCYQPDGNRTLGLLTTDPPSDDPAYNSSQGWDFATGIGTVNVTNLVNAWP